MKKFIVLILLLSLSAVLVQAQTKIFKEISEEISSQIKLIRQDNVLVGYIVFTQLEKASEDSFNYKITIMDENLNDIGTVNFREEKLYLQAVSFEQDVLCLAYLKTNILGNGYKNRRAFKSALNNVKNSVFLQFLNLDGKITKTHSFPVEISVTDVASYYTGQYIAEGKLKHEIQIQNISKRGFAIFYGDDRKCNLFIYSYLGNQHWYKQVKDADAQAYGLLTSGDDVYLLVKKKDAMTEGGFELLGYRSTDSSSFPRLALKDKQGNSLKVLTFANDPNTGKPYLSGNIIHASKGNRYMLGRQLGQGAYMGVFTINVNGPKKADRKEVYSYWSDASQSFINKKGYCTNTQAYARFATSFKDYQGNTYYVGSSVVKRIRVGTLASSAITAILILPPLVILPSNGIQKCRYTDAVLIKQSEKGALSFENSIATDYTKFFKAGLPLSMFNNRNFYNVTNTLTKTDYLIVDDAKDIFIYNVNQKKVIRKIPHKDGNVRTYVFPAKEGHVMVSEYNRKEKYTRFSIEAL